MPRGNPGVARKQFCPQGHDTFITGRNKHSVCTICRLEMQKKWRLTHKEQIMRINIKSNLKCKYGMTENDYNRLFQIQGGKCAICGKHQNTLPYTLNVDHDHKTGNVRGLLCVHCNVALGHYENMKEKCELYLRGRL